MTIVGIDGDSCYNEVAGWVALFLLYLLFSCFSGGGCCFSGGNVGVLGKS